MGAAGVGAGGVSQDSDAADRVKEISERRTCQRWRKQIETRLLSVSQGLGRERE